MDEIKIIRSVFSFFVPGLGQLMNGTVGRGLKFLFGFIILWFALLFTNLIYLRFVIALIVRVFAAYDTFTYHGF